MFISHFSPVIRFRGMDIINVRLITRSNVDFVGSCGMWFPSSAIKKHSLRWLFLRLHSSIRIIILDFRILVVRDSNGILFISICYGFSSTHVIRDHFPYTNPIFIVNPSTYFSIFTSKGDLKEVRIIIGVVVGIVYLYIVFIFTGARSVSFKGIVPFIFIGDFRFGIFGKRTFIISIRLRITR